MIIIDLNESKVKCKACGEVYISKRGLCERCGCCEIDCDCNDPNKWELAESEKVK